MTHSFIYGMNIIILMVLFVALVKWAWSAKRKANFNRYAQIPLDKEAQPPSTPTSTEENPL